MILVSRMFEDRGECRDCISIADCVEISRRDAMGERAARRALPCSIYGGPSVPALRLDCMRIEDRVGIVKRVVMVERAARPVDLVL